MRSSYSLYWIESDSASSSQSIRIGYWRYYGDDVVEVPEEIKMANVLVSITSN